VTSGGRRSALPTHLTVSLCPTLPLLPVILRFYVPPPPPPPLFPYTAPSPPPVTVPGEKLAVAPAGNPLAPSVTTPVNPFNAPMLVVYVVALPTITVCVLGLPDIVKSGVVVARGTI